VSDGWGMPPGASTIAPDVDFLWNAILILTSAVGLGVVAVLAVFVWRYRRRPGVKPHYITGNRTAEIVWTAVPGAILVALTFAQMPAWAKAKQGFPRPDEKPVTIDAIAQCYEWNFRYRPDRNVEDCREAIDPEEDGSKVAAIGEAVTPKTLFVPIGRKALITLTSVDVIHSLFIPHMRVKQDAVPGMHVRLWFEPSRFQVFEVATGKAEWVRSEEEFDRKYRDTRVGFGMSWTPRYDEETREVRVGLCQGATTTDIQHQGRIHLNQPASSATHAIGVFEIACAELCGNGHYKMESSVRVGTTLMYRAWLGRQTEFGTPPIWRRWVERRPAW